MTQPVKRKEQHNGAESLVGQHNGAESLVGQHNGAESLVGQISPAPLCLIQPVPEAGKQQRAGAFPKSALRGMSSNLRISCQTSICS